MTLQALREIIKMERFIELYCPLILNVKHKLRGIDGNGKAIDFSELEKKQLNIALQKFAKQIVKVFLIFIILCCF